MDQRIYQRLYKCPRCGWLTAFVTSVCQECGFDKGQLISTVGYWQDSKGFFKQLFNPGHGQWVEKDRDDD